MLVGLGAEGKITEYHHPINNYRLYKEDDPNELLRQLELSSGNRPDIRRTKRSSAK